MIKLGEISSNETLNRNNYANEFIETEAVKIFLLQILMQCNWGKFAALCIKAEESPVLKGLRSMPCK
ncbi:hypothetical protein [Klebsiella pneumoniae]|uniref:hypothetical protein n=1 Tax=Klebsiella pneumoniae TaxID=573 RepID=UPI0009B9DDF1|nr:hypothetical protein [Klebsiella pneumoniae]EIX9177249.1 hypothetical protein [Klebsiella pneumoniae]MBO3720233.1 hypothetical protein [Klebsiella pneumoniae]MCJ6257857.1 hypothetical protein [Klebsiella pneumoniae]UVG13591.1 hypothetical protein NWT79_23755 [Klebsiella pneumoniae]UVG18563.1 hypothetical protein NWT73_23755 [Klebsiella pneumoniae]